MSENERGGAANAARPLPRENYTAPNISATPDLERRYAGVLLAHGPDNDAPDVRAARLRLLAVRDYAATWRVFPEAHGRDALQAILLASDTADAWCFSSEARQVKLAAACVGPLVEAAQRLDQLEL